MNESFIKINLARIEANFFGGKNKKWKNLKVSFFCEKIVGGFIFLLTVTD